MEHSERGRYVTDLVGMWIVNDSDYHDRALFYAEDAEPSRLGLFATEVLSQAPEYSAPWHTAQELAPNDYSRIDWREVARQIRE